MMRDHGLEEEEEEDPIIPRASAFHFLLFRTRRDPT